MPTPLHDHHEAVAEALLEHQECLIGLELDLAAARLAELEAALTHHIAVEDRYLIPAYAAQVETPARGGAPQLFFDEHRKIERLFTEIAGFMRTLLEERSHPGLRRGVLKLIERELTLAHVLEHHHLREEQILLPVLEEKLEPEALAGLLARLEGDR